MLVSSLHICCLQFVFNSVLSSPTLLKFVTRSTHDVFNSLSQHYSSRFLLPAFLKVQASAASVYTPQIIRLTKLFLIISETHNLTSTNVSSFKEHFKELVKCFLGCTIVWATIITHIICSRYGKMDLN